MTKIDSLFHIRKFTQSDETAIISVWKNCGLVVPQNNPQEDIDLKRQVNPELFLVGLFESQIVATVMAGYEGHRGWINYLAVLPEYQGKGFGRQIMTKAESKLKELGCPKINLQIRSTNKSVITFYESLGFKDDEVLSMGKRLTK